MTRILVTGAAGFVGHHFVEHTLKKTDWQIIALDRLNYASSGFDRLRDVDAFDDKRVLCLAADFTKPIEGGLAQEIGQVDYIFHLGGETHVDNSIKEPEPFVMNNVVGTMRMLDFARKLKDLKCFFFFSTDEVFGPAPEGVNYKEWDRYNSTNPYSATKAGAEELCLAYSNTYKIPMITTHCMNIYGERQHPEKFIPMCIKKISQGETIFIHSNADRTKAGARHWIHARNVAAAVHFLVNDIDLRKNQYPLPLRDKFNIVGEKEIDNLTMAQTIASILGKKLKYELIDFHSSRPGHDLRYSLDGTKMAELGWKLPLTFEKSLERTVKWYLKEKNAKWLKI